MKLDEAQTRAKVVELLDGRDMTRMNLWITSGTFAGVLDAVVVERVMREEVELRAPHVREYWLDEPCTCGMNL